MPNNRVSRTIMLPPERWKQVDTNRTIKGLRSVSDAVEDLLAERDRLAEGKKE